MTNTLEFKKLSKDAIEPERGRLDAGYDIFAAETVILEPQEKAKIRTDIAVNIPEGYVGLLTSRSGVSSKTHLVIETGKIDAGFQRRQTRTTRYRTYLDTRVKRSRGV